MVVCFYFYRIYYKAPHLNKTAGQNKSSNIIQLWRPSRNGTIFCISTEKRVQVRDMYAKEMNVSDTNFLYTYISTNEELLS